MKMSICICYFLSSVLVAETQTKTDDFLKTLITSHAGAELKHILDSPSTFRYQLIYTKIDRDKNNKPHFTHYFYNLNPDQYFNPASTVKLPLALLALEKMNSLRRFGIDRNTPMITDSSDTGQTAATKDSSSSNGLPSLAQYIKKIFLVSDNDAYNRLYEFLGQEYINRSLWQKGYPGIRITRRFVPMDDEQNRHTNRIYFGEKNKILYEQPAAYSNLRFDFSRKILVGKAHYDRNENLVDEPMDFTKHNNVSLEDLQQILQSVLFPNETSNKRRFRLTRDDYRFLYQYMSEYPSESNFPTYDTSEYFDSYTKFFMFKAGKKKIPPHIRVFNKPGWSYGFLTDVAYIVDFKSNVEFMLSGTIYVNSDGILNDDKYEYEQTGYPFFQEVGNLIYQYELSRSRKFKPDLQVFKLNYTAQH